MLTKHVSMLVMLIMLMACSDTSIIVPDNAQSKGPHVSRTGVVKASPDIIRASIGVQTFNEDAETAVAINNEKVNAIFLVFGEKEDLKNRFLNHIF